MVDEELEKATKYHIEQLTKNLENCDEDAIRNTYHVASNLERLYFKTKNFEIV